MGNRNDVRAQLALAKEPREGCLLFHGHRLGVVWCGDDLNCSTCRRDSQTTYPYKSMCWKLLDAHCCSLMLNAESKINLNCVKISGAGPAYPNFSAKRSAFRCVYRWSMAIVLCPLILATSIGFSPRSNNLLTAS